MPITPREIEDQFEDAALTLRRLPNPPGSGAKGYGQSWPEYVHDAKQAYGYDEVRMRVVPSARDIQRMEDCIGWLAGLARSRGCADRLAAGGGCAVASGLHPSRGGAIDRVATLGGVPPDHRQASEHNGEIRPQGGRTEKGGG